MNKNDKEPSELASKARLAISSEDIPNMSIYEKLMNAEDAVSLEEHIQGKDYQAHVSAMITLGLVGFGFLTFVSTVCGVVGRRVGVFAMISVTAIGVIHHIIFDLAMNFSLYTQPVSARVTDFTVVTENPHSKIGDVSDKVIYYTDVSYEAKGKAYGATIRRRRRPSKGQELSCKVDPYDPKDIVESRMIGEAFITNTLIVAVTGFLFTFILLNT